MKLSLTELDVAARRALESFDGCLSLALIGHHLIGGELADPELTFEQASEAVGALIVSEAMPRASLNPEQALTLVRGLHLSAIAIDGFGDRRLELSAPQVALHPMFGQWIGPTFASAVDTLLKAGACWTQLSPGAPVFNELHVTDYGGGVLGVHLLTTWKQVDGATLHVTAFYGAAGSVSNNRRVLVLDANSVIQVGFAPLVNESARADEVAHASAISSAVQVAGGHLH